MSMMQPQPEPQPDPRHIQFQLGKMALPQIQVQGRIPIQLQIAQTEDVMDSRLFFLLFLYFRAVYVAFAKNTDVSVARLVDHLDNYVERGRIFLGEFRTYDQVLENVRENCGKNEMQIIEIRKSSPLEIIVSGVPLALVLAVIFSGGSIKLPGLRAELPPLGKGIRELMTALNLPDKDKTQTEDKP